MEWEFIKTIEHGIFRNRENFKRLEVPGGYIQIPSTAARKK
jgi:hypothetical protein